jgi:hypothetical protein
MEKNPASNLETYKLGLEFLKVAGLFVAGLWAYYRFFRQRTFSPNLLASWRCHVYGTQSNHFIVEFTLVLENKGKAMISLPKISVEVRGLKREAAVQPQEDGFSLELPEVLYSADTILAKGVAYEYIEPSSPSSRMLFAAVPTDYRYVQIRSRLTINRYDTFVANRLFDLDDPDANSPCEDGSTDLDEESSADLAEVLAKLAGLKKAE